MHLPLFKALRSINISDDAATEVVGAFEEYLEMSMTRATQPLLQRIDSLQAVLTAKLESNTAKIDALTQLRTESQAASDRRSQLVRWVVSTAVAAVAATLGVLKVLGMI